MKMTRAHLIEPWKAHKFSDGLTWYVGPAHGRIAIEQYPNRQAAVWVAQMQRWLIKELKLSQSKGA
jgi:hypothetical protein